ncbi:MAG: heat-inducible transcriptional repressor HrcA [Alphaproteobacteria bacterium]|nr:heat-inducible transcriptional repressor HrcA [Alphaproteobacteria bacterium]
MPNKLSERSREILRHVVETYVETGEPVGSRTLSRRSGLQLSPATIRNVMADLEELGLLYAPHTSAGRLPTEAGLRLFVDGILEIGNLTRDERTIIEAQCRSSGLNAGQVLEQASSLLSGLSQCAALVMAPKLAGRLRHIEFVNLGPGRALVVLVGEGGDVENRVIDVPLGMPASSLVEASNYMTARMIGRTLAECRTDVQGEIREHRSELDALASKVVENGLAVWANNEGGLDRGVLIVRGQAKLLEDVTAMTDLERIRGLFEALETKEALLRLIDAADVAQGVQIFIGSENELFSMAGCSMVIAPFSQSDERIVGAIGVIGPTRMNYARIIPMVDYTAKIVSGLLSK